MGKILEMIKGGRRELTLEEFLGRIAARGIRQVVLTTRGPHPTFPECGEEIRSWYREDPWPEGSSLLDLSADMGGDTYEARFGMSLSGHLYRGAPHETDNSCGNCDGARCETCVEIHEVELVRIHMVPCRRCGDVHRPSYGGSACYLCNGTLKQTIHA